MTAKIADRVKETTTTTGTGTVNLGGAASGFQTFVAGIGTTNTCYYAIVGGTEWEVGIGTVTSGSPDTLSRTTVLASSNSGALVSFSAGTKDVFCTLAAAYQAHRAIDSAWQKQFFVDAGLLPANERVVASLATMPTVAATPVGTWTPYVGGATLTGVPSISYWDLGALRSEVLFVVSGLHIGSGGGNITLWLSSGAPDSAAAPDGYTAWMETANGFRIQRRGSGAYTVLTTSPTAMPFANLATQNQSIGTALYYKDSTNVLKFFMRLGSGSWELVGDTTDTTYTTMRYVSVRYNNASTARITLPVTAWSD